MKKLALVLTAVAGFGGQAMAADMAARPMKAPPMVAPVANWTGCYLSGGGGYGIWKQENTTYDTVTRAQLTATYTASGDGYFGTVGGGCDYQFSSGLPWQVVVGAFADYDFADIKGDRAEPFFGGVGREKLSQQWAVGGRVGVLITPQLLTYVNGGYTEAKFDQTNYTNLFPPFGVANGIYTASNTYSGWFIGSGYEYALNFLPGLFWKTEYRASYLDTDTVPLRIVGTGLPSVASVDQEKWVHTVRSQLVWRFNWGGPVVAKY